MENSKRNTKILIAVIICIIAICVVIAIGKNDTKVYAMQSSLQQSNLHSINDIVSATEIEDNGYLYNYDGSIDYIYIDFAGSNGYIILLEETLEIVEYTTQGDFPYENIDGDKYYGGPNASYVKNENNYPNGLYDFNNITYNGDEIKITIKINQIIEQEFKDYIIPEGTYTFEKQE